MSPVKEFTSLSEVEKTDDKKRTAIGYFETKESVEYQNFQKVASILKDDCIFQAGFGEVTEHMHPPGKLNYL